MENLKSLSLISNILVATITISMSIGNCRVLKPNDAEFVAKICMQTPYPSFCLESLQADPRSSSADAKGLALIMVDVIKAKTTEAFNKINKLFPWSTGEDTKSLSLCHDGYKLQLEATIPSISELILHSLYHVDLAFYDEGVVASVAESCEAEFSAGNSPLTSENNVVNIAAMVGQAITKIAFNITR